MNTDNQFAFNEILANRKYLTNQAKKIAFDHLDLGIMCKDLVMLFDKYENLKDSDQDQAELTKLCSEILDSFEFFMDKIGGISESQRIRNRLSKSKSKKNQKTEKQQKIDDATLFQLNGFALQLGELKGEKVSIGQALKFLLDHAVKTIQFS
jgi:hypothetical protein